MKRMQHSGKRSDWAEVPHRVVRFLTDHIAAIDGPPVGVAHDEPVKIALALHGLEHQTTWITIADGQGEYLAQLELRLEAAGDMVTKVRWETVYAKESVPPEKIQLRTVWTNMNEHDLSRALGLLFLFGACAVSLLLYATCAKHGEHAVDKLLHDDGLVEKLATSGGGGAGGYRSSSYRHEYGGGGARKARID